MGDAGLPSLWHHLIYAYIIEQTRAYEIFERVLFEFLHGEVLEVASGRGTTVAASHRGPAVPR